MGEFGGTAGGKLGEADISDFARCIQEEVPSSGVGEAAVEALDAAGFYFVTDDRNFELLIFTFDGEDDGGAGLADQQRDSIINVFVFGASAADGGDAVFGDDACAESGAVFQG